jgi:hypothetical protein
MSKKPATIEEAAAACRASFAANSEATHAWCCHHKVFLEKLAEPPENRIYYILHHKLKDEQITRLNNFRPALSLSENYLESFDKAVRAINIARNKLWKTYDKTCDRLAKSEARKAEAAAPDWDVPGAWDTYMQAFTEAQDSHEAARKEAWKIAEVERNKAWEAYKAALDKSLKAHLKAYRKDVPFGTWNGKSIF